MQLDITNDIRNFVVDTFLFGQGDELRNSDSFLEGGLIDSTGILELVSLVEERYGVNVEDQELTPENFDSVERIAAFVNRKLNLGSDISISSGELQQSTTA